MRVGINGIQDGFLEAIGSLWSNFSDREEVMRVIDIRLGNLFRIIRSIGGHLTNVRRHRIAGVGFVGGVAFFVAAVLLRSFSSATSIISAVIGTLFFLFAVKYARGNIPS